MLARRSSKLKSGILSFLCISGLDLIGEEAELVALRFAEVGGVGFLEEQEKVNDVIFGQIQVDDPRSPALAPPDQRHADLAQTPATLREDRPAPGL